MREKFAGQIVCALPMYPQEPKGLEMIARVAEDLMESKVAI
jgi:hypothetical protein